MIIKDNFVNRHNGPSEAEQQKMLAVIGVKSMDELIEKTVPNAIRLPKPLDLPEGMTEGEYLNHIHGLMAKNKIYRYRTYMIVIPFYKSPCNLPISEIFSCENFEIFAINSNG